jgi:hypothetical protein
MEQVRKDFRRSEVVHGDDLEAAPTLEVRADEIPPDAPESIDSYFECQKPSPESIASESSPACRQQRCEAALYTTAPPKQSSPASQPMSAPPGAVSEREKRSGRDGKRRARTESSEDDLSARFTALRTAAPDGV